MGDHHSRSHSRDAFHILGFGSICKACKSFLSKCYPEKNSLFLKKTGNKTKPKSIEDGNKINRCRNQKPANKNSDTDNMQGLHGARHVGDGTPAGLFRRRSCDDCMIKSAQGSPPVSTSTAPSGLTRNVSHGSSHFLRSTSRRGQTPTPPATASFRRSMSQKNSSDAASAAFRHSLSRSASRPGSTPILFSNSNGIMKPPAMEQQLDCTLEELCFGCIKKIKITRDAITDDGQIIEEDEVLVIKVKPGWRKGTRITFEGMGSEMPGTDPADVIFIVAETEHPLFRRRDDDLEMEIEIQLVEALTGGTLPITLLGGQTMSLTISDIVLPGSERIIAGQGMPKQNEPGTRGNLIITFSVKFPGELAAEQRAEVANILQHTC